MRGAHLLQLLRAPWALERASFDIMAGVVERWSRGGQAPPSTLEQVRADSDDRQRRRGAGANVASGVAVIPIYGVLAQRGNLVDELSGAGCASTQLITQALRQAITDDSVDSILLDFDTPGGSVFSIDELATEILQARSRKPIVAIANSLCASAGYWLASQATEIYCTPSGEIGSLGVVAAHADFSKQDEMIGVKVTYVFSGQHKIDANPHEPLSEDARDYEQSRCDTYYRAFTGAVARGRGKTVADVRSEAWGQGRCLGSADAAKVGMIDAIGTFDAALSRARTLKNAPRGPTQRAALAAVGRARMQVQIQKAIGSDIELALAELAKAEATLRGET